MLKTRLVARVLPGLAVSAVLVASFIAAPIGSIFGSLSGYGYGVCGYGPSAFAGAAVVSNVSPNSGTTAGGTTVFITGSGYCNTVSGVKFGLTAVAPASINVLSDTLIQVVSPAHVAATVDVTVTNKAGTSATSSADLYTFAAPAPSVYTALTPQRIWDTRTNNTPLGQGGSLTLSIGGVYVPANATAVVLNVTAVRESTDGFFTVYPTGGTLPISSNLNWVAGETVPNLVTVGLSAFGDVTIYNGIGTADAVVDLEGYFAPAAGGSTFGQFVAVVPARVIDTRGGSPIGAGGTLNVTVTGANGIPATGVSAVVLNVTAVRESTNGFFTVYPNGQSLPLASNLNWNTGVTVPNRVIVPVGTGGMVSIFNGLGTADAVVDVGGYFTDATRAGQSFFPVFPARITDTRSGSPVSAGTPLTVTVAGNGGVPSLGAKAVIANITVARPSTASFLTVYPTGVTAPTSSDLNFVAGQTVPNLVVVKLSALGQIDILNGYGTTDVIVDVVGYFA
jgi:IPT/TIG domain-containing protein